MARLDELVANHKYCRDPEPLHDTEGLGDDWIQVARQQQAGEVAHMFLDTYLPFAENGSGDLLYVDTRGGQQQGFVREFGWEVADDCDPVSASLTDYVDSVRISIESGTEHSDLRGRRAHMGRRLQRQPSAGSSAETDCDSNTVRPDELSAVTDRSRR
ncbi:SMI1/KNR4 family protein [Rhodococcus globerulus]|uniref:SMI1/KNR4 family protein n=1 Tax=Rhodococcus globerulus TaxID=33008 RepID=UPI00374E6D94